MATSSSLSQSRERENILNKFQEITGLNIEDAIHFLDQYNWELTGIVEDYYNGIELKQKPNINPSLGKFYSNNNSTEQHDEDSDRHYAQLLHLYGDAVEWNRKEQSNKTTKNEVNYIEYNTSIRESFTHSKCHYLKSPTTKFYLLISFLSEPIYHEKQYLMRCGLHSLNNLFQIPKLFTPRYLESIVQEYDKGRFFNDYRTLWLGDYDLRILIEAVRRSGFQVRQINIYHGESLSHLPWDSYFGLLINLDGAHWFTIKNLNGIYYNLDSTLRKPIEIGQKQHLIQYLFRLIKRTQTVHLFVVLKQVN